MKHRVTSVVSGLVAVLITLSPCASAYLFDLTVPQGGGCAAANDWNLSQASPLNRRWST